jgi:hypothetical protein
MNSLNGTFRTTFREQSAMVLMRAKCKLSMNQIARVMKRSTQTIHKYVAGVGISNRRLSPSLRRHLTSHFRRNLKQLQLRMKMFLKGLCNFTEAIQCSSIPLVTLDWFLSENSSTEEAEDPA